MSRFLEKYGKDSELHLLSQLKRPDVSSDTIDKALRHGSVDVRKAAASNPNADHSQLMQALGDPHHWVRTTAAGNPNLSKEHLDIAFNDKDNPSVRAEAARHKNATNDQLMRASKDDNYYVHAAAEQNLESRK